MSGRTRKVESQLKEIVGEEVAALSDPRIRVGLVTVTGVRVSPDLSTATVFYSVLSGELEGAREGLQSAAGRIQGAVGSQTRLKRTPRLHFEPDPVVKNVDRIEAALKDIREETGEDAGTNDKK
jgi:ribosome-binding factor A